ncbi:MAG: hypothetical protein IJP17_04745 [Clostridia bacterium]|nr:hypothetical protein [Clostridia bacterium]
MNNNYEPLYPYEYDANGNFAPIAYPEEFGTQSGGVYYQPIIGVYGANTGGNEIVDYLQKNVPQKKQLHPLIVLAMLIFCFPLGLLAMFFFTKWGGFPKAIICIFVLAIALAVYEILITKNIVALPSIIDTFSQAFSQFSA